jgi:hypothetical protein
VSGSDPWDTSKVELVPQHSMSVGDKLMVASIDGLPDTDYFGDFESWEYTGSNISDVITLTTSSIHELLHGPTGSISDSYLNVDTTSEIADGILQITKNHVVLVKSESVWSFERMADVSVEYKMVSSSLEEISITSINEISSSGDPFYVQHYDIEPQDTYFVNGVLVHN